MKKYINLLAVFLVLFYGCEPAKEPTLKPYIIKKIVKGKSQGEQTDYQYKFNLWKGNFYHVPDIHSVYYLVYSDGSYDAVNVGKFITTNIGDTIEIIKYKYTN